MSERPRLHAIPVLAQPDLMCCRRFARLAHARVAGNIVGVAENLLTQSVEAVVDVVQGRRLRHSQLKFSDCGSDLLLSCSLATEARTV